MVNQTLGLGEQILRRKPILFQRKAHSGEELKRNLSTFQLMMFGVGATVGTGIFFVLNDAVPMAGPAVIFSFVIAGITAGLSALCYAELAAAIPVSGSTYSYAYHALGEGAAVVVAGAVLLEYGVAISAVAVGWSEYFNKLLELTLGYTIPTELSVSFMPGPDGEPTGGFINLPAVILILLVTLLLVRGASESATVNAIMVIIKLGVLGLFIVIGFTAFQIDHFEGFWDKGPSGIAIAAGHVFFSFIGLDSIATAGEEVKNPQKAIPRAIIGAMVIVTTTYILVCIAGLAAKNPEWFENAGGAGLAQIMQDVTGSTIWPIILSAGAVVSVFSVTLVTMYGQTRILFAVGRDGLISKRFLEVSPKHGTPVFNTVVVGICVAVVAGFVHADHLWNSVSFGTLVAFSSVAISLIVMRFRRPDLERPFRVPGYPVVPILTVAACVYLLVQLPPETWILSSAWMAVVVLYYLFIGRRNATLDHYTSEEEIAEPIHPEMEK